MTDKEKQVFHKYPKIRLLGHKENEEIIANPDDDIVIEEKIDGANFRFMIKDNRVIFGSRTQSIGDSNQEIGGNWKRCVEYIKGKVTNFQDDGNIFYGECCTKHTMNYEWDKIPPFLGFDIYNFNKKRYLNYESKKQIFDGYNLVMVPLIKIIKAKEITELSDKDVPESAYAAASSKDRLAEGICLKNYKTQTFAKYVRAKFREENIKTFGSSKKWATDDSERIVAMYCTNPRIDKMIFKLIDEGNELDMPLMHLLPKAVTEDIFEEHWKDICYSNYAVDFKALRKSISARCFNVLKQVIVNNALQKKVKKQ